MDTKKGDALVIKGEKKGTGAGGVVLGRLGFMQIAAVRVGTKLVICPKL